MEAIINQLITINKPHIYLYDSASEEMITAFEGNFTTIPSEYRSFIRLSDGLGVTEYYDCVIYSLSDTEKVLKSSMKMHDPDLKKGLLHIGCFWEDALYIDLDNKVYLSFQGIDEPVCLDMSFKEFLQKSIDTGFEIFWDERIQLI